MIKILRNGLLFALMLAMFCVWHIDAYASVESKRIKGNDRYKTAVEISKEGWDGSDYVILATGQDYPDALSAAPLAKKNNAPILLTERDSLNADTAAEIKRLKATKIILVGGTGVISKNVEEKLSNMMGYTVTRIAGADRYETAVKVAQKLGSTKSIAIVTGENYPDAISIAPIAAKMGMPILLVAKNSIPLVVKDYISGKNYDNTYVVGGYDDISKTVEDSLKNPVRISGNDKYERNIGVIKQFQDSIDFDTIYAATGNDFPDALAASVLAAKGSHPVILTDTTVPWMAKDYLRSRVISNIVILGATGAVSSSVESVLEDIPAKIDSLEPISVSVFEKEKYELPKTVTAKLDNNLKSEVPVKWSLSTVDTSKPGTFEYEGTVKGYSGKAKLTLTIKPVIVSVNTINAEVMENSEFHFPSTVTVKYSDNTVGEYPVKWQTKTISIGSVGNYAFQGELEDTDKKVTLNLKVLEDEEVEIKDSVFKKVICHELDKSVNEAVYRSDLLSIRRMESYSRGTIESLDGIQYMTNLKELELSGYSIENISNLKSLTQLERLDLSNNEIKDAGPLQNLVNLEYLDLSDNSITDIKALKNLANLRYLYLDDNRNGDKKLTDFSPTRDYYDDLEDKDFDYDSEY